MQVVSTQQYEVGKGPGTYLHRPACMPHPDGDSQQRLYIQLHETSLAICISCYLSCCDRLVASGLAWGLGVNP